MMEEKKFRLNHDGKTLVDIVKPMMDEKQLLHIGEFLKYFLNHPEEYIDELKVKGEVCFVLSHTNVIEAILNTDKLNPTEKIICTWLSENILTGLVKSMGKDCGITICNHNPSEQKEDSPNYVV